MKKALFSILLLLSLIFLFACNSAMIADNGNINENENTNEGAEEVMANINNEEEITAEAKSGEGEGGADVKVKMTATVDELGEKITVTVIESEYAYGVYWVITGNDEFYNKNGEKISRDEICVGDTVEIIYNGQVMMSYPPQIVARKITVLNR